MTIYKCGELVDPGKYLNILLNAQSSLNSKKFEFTIFNESFDPGYNLLKVDVILVQHSLAMSSYKFGGLVDPGKYRNILLNAQSSLNSKKF